MVKNTNNENFFVVEWLLVSRRIKRGYVSVVKSGRKRQQETDSCINSRKDTVVIVTLSSSLSVAVPSFFLSLSFRSSPSFLLFPCDVTRSSGKCTQNKKSHIQPLPCVFVLL